MPTAVSVVADVLDVARALRSGVPGLMTRGIQMQVRKVVPIEELRSRYFLRFNVENKPGVLARIALALGDAGVTVEQMVQEEAPSGVHVVMTTHQAIEKELRKALNAIAAQSFVVRPTQVIRVVG
jgi:homoserine dehydrogenase